MDLDLSMVSDDEFQCYNTSEGKPVHTNVDDELQLLPKETNLTPETGVKTNSLPNESHQSVRKSKRIPNAKQTEKLCITVHRQAILLLVVESGTRKFRCLSVECLFVESGTYDVICQFCTVKGMVVESEVLKAQSCALSKLSLPMHSNVRYPLFHK